MLLICLISLIIIVKISFYCVDLYRENCVYVSETKKLCRQINDLTEENRSLQNRMDYIERYGEEIHW